MFKFTLILTLAASFAATVLAGGVEEIEYTCNTGPVQCCESFESVSNTDAPIFATLFNVDVKQITGQAGFECNPITAIGKGSASSCNSAPVCCDDVNQATLVGLNCSPAIANV